MSWLLRRYRFGETVTDGLLILPNHETHYPTLERPWLPGLRGGMPFASCVPDGTYQLEGFTRPNGDHVLRLWNGPMGVYRHPGDVPAEGGRSLILIHAANWAHQVHGCIAVGLDRIIDEEGRAMVRHSRAAMKAIMEQWYETSGPADTNTPKLNIVTAAGAYQ